MKREPELWGEKRRRRGWGGKNGTIISQDTIRPLERRENAWNLYLFFIYILRYFSKWLEWWVLQIVHIKKKMFLVWRFGKSTTLQLLSWGGELNLRVERGGQGVGWGWEDGMESLRGRLKCECCFWRSHFRARDNTIGLWKGEKMLDIYIFMIIFFVHCY